MKQCGHCGITKSPCWRKGPPEKPVLCNACGARYLVKRSLEGYFPGHRAASSTHSGSSSQLGHQQPRARKQQREWEHDYHPRANGGARTPSRKRHRQLHQLQQEEAGGGACSAECSTAGSVVWEQLGASSSQEQELSPEVEQPAQYQAAAAAAAGPAPGDGSRKRSRLVACSVTEVDAATSAALRCQRTFETPGAGW